MLYVFALEPMWGDECIAVTYGEDDITGCAYGDDMFACVLIYEGAAFIGGT